MNTAGRNLPPAIEPVPVSNATLAGGAPGLMDAPMPVPALDTQVRIRLWLPTCH